MSRFGFIFHPLDLDLYADGFNDQDMKNKRPSLVRKVMTWLPAFKRETVTGIRSKTGKRIEGDMILVSLLPEQILTLDSKVVLNKIIEGGRLAEELGDKIVGLGAYASQVGHKGALIAKNIDIPVTTGNSYTIAVSIDATIAACNLVGIDISKAQVCIIGATGNIGSICARVFSMHSPKKLVLTARHLPKLEQLAGFIKKKFPKVKTKIELDIYKATKDSDIIITATSTPLALLDVSMLKKGAVVCDVSRPRNVSIESKKLRPDILVIDGGVVRPPGNVDFHFSFGLPPGLAYACMAETMILALEDRYESYSLGGNLTLEKVEEMKSLAVKHGFELAKLRSFDEEITPKQIERVSLSRVYNGNGMVQHRSW
ncbi:MAG: shikimate dehydrogenase [Candidatus Omnitrophota bacterium]